MWVNQAGKFVFLLLLLCYFISVKFEAQQDRVLAQGQKLVSDRSSP